MSVKVMGRVWDADLPPNHKLVLLAYADAAEHDGTRSYPGWERLVQMTGYSRMHVHRITSELLGSGLLVQVRAGRRNQRAEFRIPLERIVSQDATLNQPFSVTSDGDNVTPSVLPVPSSPNGDASHLLFEAFYEFWQDHRYTGGVLPKSTRGRINAAVKEAREAGITADEIRERGKRYAVAWREMERTPQALLANWPRFAPAVVVEDCGECGNRGLIALDSGGVRTDWDDPASSTMAPCPSCAGSLR